MCCDKTLKLVELLDRRGYIENCNTTEECLLSQPEVEPIYDPPHTLLLDPTCELSVKVHVTARLATLPSFNAGE